MSLPVPVQTSGASVTRSYSVTTPSGVRTGTQSWSSVPERTTRQP